MNKEIEKKRVPRPANAFMLFGKHHRRSIAKQNPHLSNKQISKILGKEWRKMKPDDKRYYQRLADDVHADHMKKYPGYYYSPLEARQRKAERKRKYMQKMTIRRNNNEQVENYFAIQKISEDPSYIKRNLPINSEALEPINDLMLQAQLQRQLINCNLIPNFCQNGMRDFNEYNSSINQTNKIFPSFDEKAPDDIRIDGFKTHFGDHCYVAAFDNTLSEGLNCHTGKEELSTDDNFALFFSHLPPMDSPNIITPVNSSFELSNSIHGKIEKDVANFPLICDSLNNCDFELKDINDKELLMSEESKNLMLSYDNSYLTSKNPKVIVKREPLEIPSDIADTFLLSRTLDVCE